MNRLTSILLTYSALIALNLNGQTTFKNTYGNNNKNDYGEAIVQLDDGGLVMCGVQVFKDTTENYIGEGVIRRLDAQGNELWVKNYSDPTSDYQDLNFHHITKVNDNKLLVVGTSNYGYNNNYFDAYIAKLDINGNIIWQRTFGGPHSQSIKKVIQTSEGGFLMVGTNHTDGGANSLSLYTIKIDSHGSIEWEYTHPNTSNNPIRHQAYSVIENDNNEYIISGKIKASILSPQGLFVIKLDSLGNIMWEKTLDYFEGQARNIFIKSNGNIIVCGWHAPNWIAAPLIVEISNTGTFIKQHEFNHTNELKEWAYSFIKGDEDNIIMLSFDANSHYRVTHIDSTFNVEWSTFVIYDQASSAIGNSIARTSDHGYVCTGTSIIQGDIKSVVFKIDENGTPAQQDLIQHLDATKIYPNPTKDIINIAVSDDVKLVKIEVYNIEGKKIKVFEQDMRALDVSELVSGIYLLHFSTKDEVLTKKVIIE